MPTRRTTAVIFAAALTLTGLAPAPEASAEAAGAAAHLAHRAAAHAVDPPGVRRRTTPHPGPAMPANPSVSNPGYWLLASDGGVYRFGTAYYGSLRGQHLNQPIVGMASTPSGAGYWLVASDGGIFTFGDAHYYGSTGAIHLNRPIVGMATTPTGGGYWLVASDGGIFTFGDAHYYGSTGAIHLNRPIVGMAATPTGGGYWLVASDGGIFTFGDAHYYGSMGGTPLNRPVLGMAAVPGGGGYWMVASDGGIFTFGTAVYYGSTGGIHLNQPIVGMAANPDGGGYWLVAADGGIFNFGTIPFYGSTGGQPIPFPIIGMAATRLGFPYPQGGLGNDVSWPQCRNPNPPSLPPPAPVAIVGVNDGLSHDGAGTDITRNPCLSAEANWAGPNLTVYVNVDGVLTPGQPAAMNGPAGACAQGDLLCQGYNWGWDGAARSVTFAHSLGLYPTVWWLDVEGPCGSSVQLWRCDSLASNANVIQGALDALRVDNMIGGIYSTWYQFPLIAGPNYMPGTPIWIAGASYLSDAASQCQDPSKRFGGGTPWLVQYGYAPAPHQTWDPDYACPQS